jgi:hypothetical protein
MVDNTIKLVIIHLLNLTTAMILRNSKMISDSTTLNAKGANVKPT